MRIKKCINLKNIFLLGILLHFSIAAVAENYYMACYYYDTNREVNSNNPFLMRVNNFTGKIANYFWAIDPNNYEYVKLDGKIVDGFFYADGLNYTTAKQQCEKAIHRNTFFWRSNKSYELYEMKASNAKIDAFEYPIRFLADDSEKGKIKQIVLFGDSLSDTGNLKRGTKLMPFYPFWYGRFSDGFIWDDYLKGLTHLPILNFAYGGAKTEGYNDFYISDFKDYISSLIRNIITGSSKYYVNDYVNNYLTNDSYLNKQYKVTNPEDTLYVLWIGANDFLTIFDNPTSSNDFFSNPDSIDGSNTVTKRAVDNIISQIQTLSERGGKHFLVMNLPDFGKSPLPLQVKYIKYIDGKTEKYEFSKNISLVIKQYNDYLKYKLNEIEKNSNLNIIPLDIGKNFDSILDGKNIFTNSDYDYGFSKLDSEYEIPNEPGKFIQDFCYKGNYLSAAENSLKSNEFAYISAYNENRCKTNDYKLERNATFWNIHPTSYTHCWISYIVLNKLNEEKLIPNSDYNLDDIKNYCSKLEISM